MSFIPAALIESASVVGAAGSAQVDTGAGALAASYSAAASARYGTLRYSDRNTDLIRPNDRPLLVDKAILDSLLGDLYVFTHKAIWGCWILLPTGGHLARDVINKTVQELPPTENWAFVASAECRAVSPPRVAYFIAQFGNGDFIQPLEEIQQPGNKNNSDGTGPFRALLQEQNKAHAALSIVQGPSNPDVWVNTPEIHPKRYVYRDGTLVSPGFRDDEWVPMRHPMRLRELNNRIYGTPCTGRNYGIDNNCQHFSVALFNDL